VDKGVGSSGPDMPGRPERGAASKPAFSSYFLYHVQRAGTNIKKIIDSHLKEIYY
jgi:hypothetical protein